jgi:RNA polymerase sigma factor for flagellar operon FliA
VYHSETASADSPIASLNLSDFPHIVLLAPALHYSQRRAGNGQKSDRSSGNSKNMQPKMAKVQVQSVSTRRRTRISNTIRDRIVLDHLPLVKAIAVRVHENLPVHVDLDDLVHAGVLGLFDAATKYNPDKKVVFHSYAKYRIKGAILDSLRQLDWASRDLRKRQKMVEAITRELSDKLKRTPTEAEIAEKLGVGVDRWRRMVLELRTVGLMSASSYGSDRDTSNTPEFPASRESQPDNMCAREQLRHVLAGAVKTLPERYQRVVLLYYTKEMTMKEIGGILGINESRVSQIHKTALEKMAAALHSAGIHSTHALV